MDIFAQASQQKLRFGTGKGQLSVEDLWDLSVQELNTAAIALDAQIATTGQQGYLRVKSTADTAITLRRDILVYIINEKLNQQDAAVANRSLTQQQKELAELIHAKKQQARANKSLEELEAEYNALVSKHNRGLTAPLP